MSTKIGSNLGMDIMNLASNVDTAKSSLYSLQTSLFNARGRHSRTVQAMFTPLREDLKQSWELILDFIQKSLAFGSDVSDLERYLRNESIENCVEFLMNISAASNDLLGLSELLVADSKNVAEKFGRNVYEMDRILRKSTNGAATTYKQQDSTSLNGYSDEVNGDNRYDRRNGPLEDSRKNLGSFVEASVGLLSLSSAENAFAAISDTLKTIHESWQLTSTTCSTFIKNSSASKVDITIGQAAQIAVAWKAHQEGLTEAMKSVARSCDAIMIEAGGAEPSRRHRSSSPHSLPDTISSELVLYLTIFVAVAWYVVDAVVNQEF